MTTLIEEARTVANTVSTQEQRLLAKIKEDIICHSKLGYRHYILTWQTLTYLFGALLREEWPTTPHVDEIGVWQFQTLLKKLNDVLVAEGFQVEATFTRSMDINFKIIW